MIQQVRTGSEVRRLAVIKRRSGTSMWLLALLAVVLVVVVGAGRGGGNDGTLGGAIALVVLVGGAVFIQRFSRARYLMGFNPDGVWSPGGGWIEWQAVRHIELRQTRAGLRGRRHTVWVNYEPDTWLGASPGLRRALTLELVEEMERCWLAPAPIAAAQPPDPVAAAQPPGPVAATQPPGPVAATQPPGPVAATQSADPPAVPDPPATTTT
jgi:hypothetical protein